MSDYIDRRGQRRTGEDRGGLKMTDVICDYDFCKHYCDGRCGLDTVEICGGHCQDLDDEQEE